MSNFSGQSSQFIWQSHLHMQHSRPWMFTSKSILLRVNKTWTTTLLVFKYVNIINDYHYNYEAWKYFTLYVEMCKIQWPYPSFRQLFRHVESWRHWLCLLNRRPKWLCAIVDMKTFRSEYGGEGEGGGVEHEPTFPIVFFKIFPLNLFLHECSRFFYLFRITSGRDKNKETIGISSNL